MRSLKKVRGDDLLKLALMLSLLKTDPQSYLGWSSFQSVGDPGGSVIDTHTQAMQQTWRDWELGESPRLHPKSLDSLLERHQQEILEDLNSLGRYSRLSSYGGLPVHISAYIVDTEQGAFCHQDNLDDTNTCEEDIEKEKNPEETEEEIEMGMDLEDLECETILLDNVVSPLSTVQGLDAVLGLTPPPEEEVLNLGAGQDALEAELVHIDEQLMNIEDDLGHIDEAFIMMDQQLAESISDDVFTNDVFNNNAAQLNLDELIKDDDLNPFDDWQRDSLANIEDFALDNVNNEVPEIMDQLQTLPEDINESILGAGDTGLEVSDDFLLDPDLFPTDEANSGSAVLEEFDEELLENWNLGKVTEGDNLIRQDVRLPQMEPVVLSKTEVKEDVSETDEDLIMQVLRESDIDFDEIPLQLESEDVKTAQESTEEVKVETEEIKEEVIDVEDVGFELSLTDGASAKVEIDFEKLHSDIKLNFSPEGDGSAVAELTFCPEDNDQESGFNSVAFQHDHNYLGSCMDPLGKTNTGGRRRNVSESSGYSSMTEDQQFVASRCRDEKMARKMGLPFSTWEVINCPVDTFSEMLARPGLTQDQAQLCRDIRRRGKNKVAAQNCRKRKLDTIEELQSQVDQVRRRKDALLREREQLETERARWSSKLSFLEETVLAAGGKHIGMFTLEVTDTAVVVTTRLSQPGLLAAAVGGAEDTPRGGRTRD